MREVAKYFLNTIGVMYLVLAIAAVHFAPAWADQNGENKRLPREGAERILIINGSIFSSPVSR